MTSENKAKNESIKIENLMVGTQYAITINPIHVSGFSVLDFIQKETTRIKECLFSSETWLFPEASPTGKIHFHGYLRIHNIIEWISEINRLIKIGTVCVKELDDPEEWAQYCLKQSHLFAPMFKENTKYNYPLVINKHSTLNWDNYRIMM